MLFKIRETYAVYTIVFLFSLVVMLDPPNSYFKLKDPIFLLLLGICIFYYTPNIRGFIPYLLGLSIWLTSSIIGWSNLEIEDNSFNFGVLKALSPLVLIAWIRHLNFVKALVIPTIIVAIISIIVVLSMFYFPDIEFIFYNYFTIENGLMKISRRSFWGIEIMSAFYRSSPVITLVLANYIGLSLRHKNIKNSTISIILFLGLVAAGNRACILSAFGIYIFTYIWRVHELKQYKKLLLITFTCLIIISSVLILTLGEPEESNLVKFGHLHSYYALFDDKPWILLFGQGAGSYFFSEGFGEYTRQTEWTYIDLVRYFGIWGALLIIGIFIYPILYVLRNLKRYIQPQSFILGYSFYLLIAGTNPLLLSSTGMITCLYAYSFLYYRRYDFSAKTVSRNINVDI